MEGTPIQGDTLWRTVSLKLIPLKPNRLPKWLKGKARPLDLQDLLPYPSQSDPRMHRYCIHTPQSRLDLFPY